MPGGVGSSRSCRGASAAELLLAVALVVALPVRGRCEGSGSLDAMLRGVGAQLERSPVADSVLLNYSGSVQRSGDTTHGGAWAELVASSGLGVASTQWTVRAGGNAAPRAVRLASAYVIDRPAQRTSLRIGDGVARAGAWGRPAQLGGIQWGTDFALEPGLVEAARPTGVGDAALRLLGDGFKLAPQRLRPGLHDFSYSLGLARENLGARSFDYGSAACVALHRMGWTERLTAELRAELAGERQAAGLAAVWLWPRLGLLAPFASLSRAGPRWGASAGLRFEREGSRLRWGVQARGFSPEYRELGMAAAELAPLYLGEAHVGLSLGSGSVTVRLAQRAARARDAESVFSATYSRALHSSWAMNVTLEGSSSGGGAPQRSVFVNLNRPLGERGSAALSAGRAAGGLRSTAQIQRSPDAQGWGYRFRTSRPAEQHTELEVQRRTAAASWSVSSALGEGRSSYTAAASGSLAIAERRLFFAPSTRRER